MPGKQLPMKISRSAKVSRNAVKLCELCGALNLEDNKECWTCRWRGSFSHDPKTIAFAWQRLEAQYEEVRIEHVTPRRALVVDEFGRTHPAKFPQRILLRLSAVWQRFLTQRDLRYASVKPACSTRCHRRPTSSVFEYCQY